MSEGEKRFSMRSLPRAAAAWLLCAAVLLPAAAALYTVGAAPFETMRYAGMAIAFLAAFAAGLCAAGETRGRRAVSALAITVLLCALLWLTGLLIGGAPERGGIAGTAGMTLAGCLAGALLPRTKQRRRKGRGRGRRFT